MRRKCCWQSDRGDGASVPPRAGQSPTRFPRRDRSQSRPYDHDGHEAVAAGAQEPAVERLQVHRRGSVQFKVSAAVGGWSADHTLLNQSAVVAFEVADSGIGIRWKSSASFSSLPAGRRQHQPQIRRHRAWPRHQPRARQSAGRRNPIAQHAGQRRTFTLYVPLKYVGPSIAARIAPDAPALVEKSSDYSVPVERAAEQIPDDRLEISRATAFC